MRDILKSKQYFSDFISYQEARIKQFTNLREKALEARGENDKGVKSATINLFNFSFQLLVAKYSVGASVGEMRSVFSEVTHWFDMMTDVPYADAINMISLGILLECHSLLDRIKSKVIKENLVAESIKLLLCDAQLQVLCDDHNPYAKLPELIKKSAPIDAIKRYLLEWYDASKDAYWYDSHKSSNDTYFGYWSFESAAYAKICGAEASSFANVNFFPADLV